MKLDMDDSALDVEVTRGVEGRLPDIWLTWEPVRFVTFVEERWIIRLTIDEARELAGLLIAAANTARQDDL